jgi:outer membrane protease
MITKIKVFILLVSTFLAFFMPPRVLAETISSDNAFPYTFSVGILTGFLYGQSEEIVYKPNSKTKWSQLLWDTKPLFYVGAEVNFSRSNPMEKWGFFGDLSFKGGIPSGTGIMEDRDWDSTDNHLTNYSRHDNNTQAAFLLDFQPGVSIPFDSKVLLKVSLAFSYMYFSWASQDGYLQYENYNDPKYQPWEKVPVSGPAINYIQHWFILAPGVGLWVPFKVFSLGIDFHVTPLIWCNAYDQHVARNDYFDDHVWRGFLLEPKGAFTFSPHPKLSLTLSGSYRFINGPRGASYMNGKLTGDDGAGAGYAVWDTGISVKWRF